jgi:hypothetical protein
MQDVKELVESQGEELTNEEVIQLEDAEFSADTEAEASEEQEERPKGFIAQ